MTFKGTTAFLTNPTYGSDLYFEEWKERVTPVGDEFVITEESFFVITESGVKIITE